MKNIDKQKNFSKVVKDLVNCLKKCTKAGVALRLMIRPKNIEKFSDPVEYYYYLRKQYPKAKNLFFPRDFERTRKQYSDLMIKLNPDILKERLPINNKSRVENERKEIYINEKALFINREDYYDIKETLSFVIHTQNIAKEEIKRDTRGDNPQAGILLSNAPHVFYALFLAFEKVGELEFFINSEYYEKNNFILEVGKNDLEMKWFANDKYLSETTHIIHQQQEHNPYNMELYYETYSKLFSMYLEDKEQYLRLRDHFTGIFINKTLKSNEPKRKKVAFILLQAGFLIHKYIELFIAYDTKKEQGITDTDLEKKIHQIASEIHLHQIYLDGIFSNTDTDIDNIEDKELVNSIKKLWIVNDKIVHRHINTILDMEKRMNSKEKADEKIRQQESNKKTKV